MKRTSSLLAVAVMLVSFTFSCKEKISPISERIAKVWVARNVVENSSTVYSSGGSSNLKPGYSAYRLNLSSPPQASITEIGGQTFTGTYAVQGESTLVISGISPEPTGTGGTLTFTINSISEDGSEFVITMNDIYPKTGNTTNRYTLIPQ